MSFYDDNKFGVINRTWFGLTQKNGGKDAAITMGSATNTTHISRWYPGRPIKVKKVGYLVQATMVGKATNKGRREFRFYTRGASASLIAKLLPATCGTVSAYTFNSTSSLTVAQCKSGEYLTIKSGTPVTYTTTYALGTVTQGTVNGSLAFFVDWVPTYDYTGRWDA